MQHTPKLVTAIALALTVAACATKPPARTPYAGPDNVGPVSADMLLGNWSVKVLNPIEGEENGATSASYNADGTVVMNTDPSTEGMEMTLRMTGSWEVSGDTVTQTLETIEETSVSQLGALLQPLLSGMKKRATGSANVHEATADRVILVSTENGQALEYTRMP